MSPQELIDKAVDLMSSHLDQIKRDATYLTKDGAKGFTSADAAVIERYTKLLLAMTKKTEGEDDLSALSDSELEAILNERQDNVPDTISET